MKLTGNTILITGGTSGIGLAFAIKFLKQGNTVIICGRREERLKEIKKQYPDIITRVTDVADQDQRTALADWIRKNYSNINVLMNNAGIQLQTDLTRPVDPEKLHEQVEINFIAPVHLSSLFVELLAGKPNASIINISSGLAFAPLAFMPVYCASKAAVHSYSLSLRHQLKSKGIKVFEIIPPSTDTELGHQQRTSKDQSHGGTPVDEFLAGAIEALKNDVYEAPIGESVKLHDKREAMFEVMNK
jgi:uncharacterized oxidoreductase